MRKIFTGRFWTPLAVVGAAWWIGQLATVEWSYPYCSVRDDGPAGAVYGFPLPYVQASIAASATDSFIPWLYVVNLLLIASVLYLLLRPVVARLEKWNERFCGYLIAAAAVALIATAAPLEAFALYNGISGPTDFFSNNLNYSELRPVALRVLGRQRDCTPSPFWFR